MSVLEDVVYENFGSRLCMNVDIFCFDSFTLSTVILLLMHMESGIVLCYVYINQSLFECTTPIGARTPTRSYVVLIIRTKNTPEVTTI